MAGPGERTATAPAVEPLEAQRDLESRIRHLERLAGGY
jgi:hypothetical protein